MSKMQQMLIGAGYISPLHSGTLVTIGKDAGSTLYGYSSSGPAFGAYTQITGTTVLFLFYSVSLTKTTLYFASPYDLTGGGNLRVTVNGSAQTLTWNGSFNRYEISGDPWSIVSNYPSTVNWAVSAIAV